MKEQTLRVDKDALFALLHYSPHPGQHLVHKATARFRILACGVRWGKTTCAAMEAVCELLTPRKQSMGWVVAPTYDLTRHIIERVRMTFFQYMKHRVIEDDTRSTRLVIQNLGGGTSELRGKSTDNPTSLLGEALDWVVVDEAATMREEIWESHLSPRLVDRAGSALLISTPRGVNWFFHQYYRGQQQRDPEYWSYRAPTADNPYIKPAIIEAERRRMSEDAFKQEYLGHFLGEELIPCEVCGGPSPTAVGIVVVIDPSSLPRCPRCAKQVDKHGKTIVTPGRDGKGHVTYIVGLDGLMARARNDPTFDPVAFENEFNATQWGIVRQPAPRPAPSTLT